MTPNPFIGKTEKPWSAEITKALGPSAEIWSSWWIGWRSRGVEVHFAKIRLVPLHMVLKKRTIVHLSPCGGSFRAWPLSSLTVRSRLRAKAISPSHAQNNP
jgi:hypothetical protein